LSVDTWGAEDLFAAVRYVFRCSQTVCLGSRPSLIFSLLQHETQNVERWNGYRAHSLSSNFTGSDI